MYISITLVCLGFIAIGGAIVIDQIIYRRRNQEKILTWYNTNAKRTTNGEVIEYSYTRCVRMPRQDAGLF